MARGHGTPVYDVRFSGGYDSGMAESGVEGAKRFIKRVWKAGLRTHR